MIGVIIPGTTILTGGPITSNIVVLDINDPKSVNNLGIFLQEPIPNDCGAGLYFSCPPFDSMHFIGCVANARPSDIFYTGWSLNPSVNVFSQIKICVKLEKLEYLKNSFEDKMKSDINQEYAKRIAKNLFNYLSYYNQNQDVSRNLLVVPLNTLETWYENFLKNLKYDPNFFMKSE